MKIRKLNWAGLEIGCGPKTVLIDAVENFKPYIPVLGHPLTPLVKFTDTLRADYMVFTHFHLDHFDADVVKKCLKPEGKVIGWKKHQKEIERIGCSYLLLENDEVFEENGITFKPVFSLDGIGDEQTAWVITYHNTSVFHGGDTIWHNQFWRLGKENKGITYACLPINGVVVDFRIIGVEISSVPVTLTPEQAFNAAKLLHAEKLVPIHYGKFGTPLYQPTDTSDAMLEQLSKKIGQSYQVLADGELLEETMLVKN